MSISGLIEKTRTTRILVVFLAMLLVCGVVNYSPSADTPMKNYSVDMGGVTGVANNTVLAFGRFIFVAPFAPTKGITEDGHLDLEQLNNFTLYVIDTKKPNSPVLSKDLTAWDPQLQMTRKVFFPTKIAFDPVSSTVYVRGTRYEKKEDADGEKNVPIDVMAYVQANLDDGGKPVLGGNVVMFDIRGVSTPTTNEALLDFGLSGNGKLLVFTNGASVFSYNLTQGDLYELPIVPPKDYNAANNSISFLDVHSASNVVSVCWNQRTEDKDKVVHVSSELSFYRLGEDGTFKLLKRAYPNEFPDGTTLAEGSNIAIASDGESDDSEFALFATNDGSLCAVDLHGDGVGTTIKRLYSFPELAQSERGVSNPLSIYYDSTNRAIGIVKSGFTVQISRPTGGRRGLISRPTGLRTASGASMLAMAKLSKKNKVTSSNIFSEDFKDQGGLSNFASGQDSQWLISTYSGRLYSVSAAGDPKDTKLQYVGPIGSSVDRIAYYTDRSSVVAINSFTLDENGVQMVSPGSVVIGRMSDLQTQSRGLLQALLPTATMLGKRAPSISRPCNIRR